jgi:hypothetical protein
LSKAAVPDQKCTSQVKRNRCRPGLLVTTGGRGVLGHAGARLLADLADTVGLGDALSVAIAPPRTRRGGPDRGEVFVDLAVSLADGGETISDLAVLGDQPGLFGEVASAPTAWRTLEAVDAAALVRIGEARTEARAAAWAAGADAGFYVIDIDGTLIASHSDKAGAAPTYKRAATGSIPSWRSSTPPARPSPGCCDRATPGRGQPLTMSPFLTPPSPSCPLTRPAR